MKMQWRMVGCLVGALMISGAALAQDKKLFSTAEPAVIKRFLADLGMDPGEFQKTTSGNWKVSISTETGNATVFLYCDKGACSSMQATAGFGMPNKPTAKSMNRWNEEKRFSKAYLDSDGDPRIENDLDFTGGITETNIKEFLKSFRRSLRLFAKHIDFE